MIKEKLIKNFAGALEKKKDIKPWNGKEAIVVDGRTHCNECGAKYTEEAQLFREAFYPVTPAINNN